MVYGCQGLPRFTTGGFLQVFPSPPQDVPHSPPEHEVNLMSLDEPPKRSSSATALVPLGASRWSGEAVKKLIWFWWDLTNNNGGLYYIIYMYV